MCEPRMWCVFYVPLFPLPPSKKVHTHTLYSPFIYNVCFSFSPDDCDDDDDDGDRKWARKKETVLEERNWRKMELHTIDR